MSECTKVITLQKDLHHPEAVHLDMLTMKRNYVRENYPLHIHDHYEMELVVSGEGWQWLNGEQHPLCPGMLYILSPEDVHRFAAQQPLELICLHLDGMAATPELLGLLKKCHGGAMVQLAEKNYAQMQADIQKLGTYVTNMEIDEGMELIERMKSGMS